MTNLQKILNPQNVVIPRRSFERAVCAMFPEKKSLAEKDILFGWNRCGRLLAKTPARNRDDYDPYWRASNAVQNIALNIRFSNDAQSVLIPANKYDAFVEAHPTIVKAAHAFAAARNDLCYQDMVEHDEPQRKLALFSLRSALMMQNVVRPDEIKGTVGRNPAISAAPTHVPA